MTPGHASHRSPDTCLLHEFMTDLDLLGAIGRTTEDSLDLPLVVGVSECHPNEYELALAPPGADVYDTLVGLVAPWHWHSLIIHVEGSAITGEAGPRSPVRLMLGVCRCGHSRSRLESLGDDEIPALDGEAGQGLLLDCARRVLGLPTPPPPNTTAELHSALWLDMLICATLALAARDLRWTTAAALHPASADVVDDDPPNLARAAAALARASDWGSLRRAAERGERPDLGVPAGIAAWMDDGLFARWCLANLPDVDGTLDDLAATLSPTVSTAVRSVVRPSGT